MAAPASTARSALGGAAARGARGLVKGVRARFSSLARAFMSRKRALSPATCSARRRAKRRWPIAAASPRARPRPAPLTREAEARSAARAFRAHRHHAVRGLPLSMNRRGHDLGEARRGSSDPPHATRASRHRPGPDRRSRRRNRSSAGTYGALAAAREGRERLKPGRLRTCRPSSPGRRAFCLQAAVAAPRCSPNLGPGACTPGRARLLAVPG
jgi:hypothetical protein